MLSSACAAIALSAAEPAWRPDRGDGTYRNPVLFADYSDPDAMRVGDDFWLTSSSFSHVPGLPILHSRDLVNWELVNHALPQLVPVDHFATPRPGEGVWAPAIRYHAGRFFIYYPDPDFGICVVTADDPRGRWSAPVLVRGGKGLIDPCPFWDDDGQAYLVHAWARSRAGINNLLTLRKLSPDGMRALDDGVTIIDANKIAGMTTLEGPKLYKRGGYYYIFAPAGGVTGGYQVVFRSRQIQGPYEHRIVLEQGNTPINGPHQGAWVDTPRGENWFLHFQDRGPYGRVVHLEPMRWGDDGWPVIGEEIAGREAGVPVLVHAKPAVSTQPFAEPPTSDEFDAPALGLQWQWQANPRNSWASLSAKRGVLRLQSVSASPEPGGNLWLAPNLLLQKFPAPEFVATTRLAFAPQSEGERAGLIVFGYDYAWIGLQRTGEGVALVQAVCREANQGRPEIDAASVPWATPEVVVRVSVDAKAQCRFSYSADGEHFTPVGGSFEAKVSRWVGAKVGVFASAPAARAGGHADFAWFRVTKP